MTQNFCTLFDSGYLIRGLAMYQSLARHFGDFHLYIYPFDDECLKILKQLALPKVTLVSLRELEGEELLKIKPTRSAKEYYWTCGSNSIWHTLKNFNLPSITYLDADLYFYDSPQAIFDELGQNSILLTEHRYPTREGKSELSGKYCVQFMTFKNNTAGWSALNWWRHACLNWCYDRYEDGKFGDQKYLDDWTNRFSGVHELRHLGGGVAIWNIKRYNISKEAGKIMVAEKTGGPQWPLIFYHFHSVKVIKVFNQIKAMTTQAIAPAVQKLIYDDYSDGLTRAYQTLLKVKPDFKLGLSPSKDYWRNFIGRFVPAKLKKILKKYDKKNPS